MRANGLGVRVLGIVFLTILFERVCFFFLWCDFVGILLWFSSNPLLTRNSWASWWRDIDTCVTCHCCSVVLGTWICGAYVIVIWDWFFVVCWLLLIDWCVGICVARACLALALIGVVCLGVDGQWFLLTGRCKWRFDLEMLISEAVTVRLTFAVDSRCWDSISYQCIPADRIMDCTTGQLELRVFYIWAYLGAFVLLFGHYCSRWRGSV